MANRTLEAIEDAVATALAPMVADGSLVNVQALGSDLNEALDRGRVKTPAALIGTVERRFLAGSGTPTPVYDARVDIEIHLVTRYRRSLAARRKGDGLRDGVLDLLEKAHALLDSSNLGMADDPAVVPLQPVSDRISHPEPGLTAATLRFATTMIYRTG